MIYLLEVKKIGSSWLPRRILEEENLRTALDHLIVDKQFVDWRVRRIDKKDVPKINAQITVQWS